MNFADYILNKALKEAVVSDEPSTDLEAVQWLTKHVDGMIKADKRIQRVVITLKLVWVYDFNGDPILSGSLDMKAYSELIGFLSKWQTKLEMVEAIFERRKP